MLSIAQGTGEVKDYYHLFIILFVMTLANVFIEKKRAGLLTLPNSTGDPPYPLTGSSNLAHAAPA